MPTRERDAAHEPLRPADLFILLVLSHDDLHGYGIMKAVDALSAGKVRVEIGSLYRVLARMMEADLVGETSSGAGERKAGRAVADDRRRYYRLTAAGRRALRSELARLKSVVALPAARRLLDDRDSPS